MIKVPELVRHSTGLELQEIWESQTLLRIRTKPRVGYETGNGSTSIIGLGFQYHPVTASPGSQQQETS